jgi:hypothetical protein
MYVTARLAMPDRRSTTLSATGCTGASAAMAAWMRLE